ncbi:MAG: hypothetical protein YHS30scaffold667_51 [Phage 65_10]|nr:MAG: hypothetical protein YHS30scaffold667_51 [Phage 65_10]
MTDREHHIALREGHCATRFSAATLDGAVAMARRHER